MRKQIIVTFDPNVIIDWITRQSMGYGYGIEGHAVMQFSGPGAKPRVYKSMGMVSKDTIPHLDSLYPGCLFVVAISYASSGYTKRRHISDIFPTNSLQDINDEGVIDAYYAGDVIKFELHKPHYLSNSAFSIGGGRFKGGEPGGTDIIAADFNTKTIKSVMLTGTYEVQN